MYSEENYILDWVEMSNGKKMTGVVDFATDKFVHFFNFDIIENDPDLVLVAVIWRARYSHMRFSVFCSTMFPNIQIPRVNLINRRGIETMSSIRHKSEKEKKTRLSIG